MIFALLLVVGCSVQPDTNVVTSDVDSSLKWMIGVWDCGIVNYHQIPQAQTVGHQGSGVYTVVEDNTGIHGTYREKDDGQFGPTDFDDEWIIGEEPWSQDKLWNLATYRAHGVTKFFEIESSGVVRRSTGPSLLGFSMFGASSEFPAVVTFPNGLGTVTRDWEGGHVAFTSGPSPVQFSRNWRVATSPGHFAQYIDDQCIRRVQ